MPGKTKSKKQVFDAWAAGFIDGEGCFCTGAVTPTQAAPKLTVCQVVREPLERLQAAYGGAIRERTPDKSTKRLAWEWSLYGQAMCECIERIHPFLVVKRRQASAAWQLATVRGWAAENRPGVLGWAVKNPAIQKFYLGIASSIRRWNARGVLVHAG